MRHPSGSGLAAGDGCSWIPSSVVEGKLDGFVGFGGGTGILGGERFGEPPRSGMPAMPPGASRRVLAEGSGEAGRAGASRGFHDDGSDGWEGMLER